MATSSAVMSPTGLDSALFPLLLPLTVYKSLLFLHFNVGDFVLFTNLIYPP